MQAIFSPLAIKSQIHYVHLSLQIDKRTIFITDLKQNKTKAKNLEGTQAVHLNFKEINTKHFY